MSTSKSKQTKVQTFTIGGPPDLEEMLANARSVKETGETIGVKARAVRSLLLSIIDNYGRDSICDEIQNDLVNPAAYIVGDVVALADELFKAVEHLPGNIERLRPEKAVRA